MADFTEYAQPSADWLALEPTLPKLPDLPPEELKEFVNKNREDASAQQLIEEGLSSRVQIHTHQYTARDGTAIDARSYRPVNVPTSQPLPVYIHLHGGGFLYGTAASEDAACARIVVSQAEKSTPVTVVNLDYRHTPEFKYPVAWNDVEDGFIWVHDHITILGGLADQVVVGGISAGGQLTASLILAQLHGDHKRLLEYPKIRGQVLMIPCLVNPGYYAPRLEMLRSPELSSQIQCAEAPVLPMSRMNEFMGLLGIRGAKGAERDYRMNPGNAPAEYVKNLPPTTFGVAGNDPLRDEALFFARLLSENGVPTNINVFRGVPHGFRRFGNKLSASHYWDQVISDGISWALSNPAAVAFEIKSD